MRSDNAEIPPEKNRVPRPLPHRAFDLGVGLEVVTTRVVFQGAEDRKFDDYIQRRFSPVSQNALRRLSLTSRLVSSLFVVILRTDVKH